MFLIISCFIIITGKPCANITFTHPPPRVCCDPCRFVCGSSFTCYNEMCVVSLYKLHNNVRPLTAHFNTHEPRTTSGSDSHNYTHSHTHTLTRWPCGSSGGGFRLIRCSMHTNKYTHVTKEVSRIDTQLCAPK